MAIPQVNSSVGSQTPSKADDARRTLGGDIDNFLKLLTVQLKNQDPTDPLDTNAVTQQIATLSQVEQQINTNKNLETLVALMNSTQYNSVVSYIGKRIEAAGDAGSLENGKAEFAYYLQDQAATVKVTIKDESGNIVYEGNSTGTARGRNQFDWDGKSSAGQTMPNGTYHVSVEALDGSNTAVQSQVFTTGVVTSVDSANGQVYLSFGDLSIPIQNVTSIRSVI